MSGTDEQKGATLVAVPYWKGVLGLATDMCMGYISGRGFLRISDRDVCCGVKRCSDSMF